ncbi:hypothetical protein ACA910_011181 [Epithemia clementina (nom. ined.)]
MVKENNGRGARRRVWGQVSALCLGAILCMVLVALIGWVFVPQPSSSSLLHHRPDHETRRNSAVLRNLASQRQHNHHDQDPQDHRTTTTQTKTKKKKKEEDEDDDDVQKEHDERTHRGKSNKRKRDHKDDDEAARKEEVLQQILQGDLHLIDLEPNFKVFRQLVLQQQQQQQQHQERKGGGGADQLDYTGLLTGSFCQLDWTQHEQDPATSPMFRFVVEQSHCDQRGKTVELDLFPVVQAARLYHEQAAKQQQHHPHDSTTTTTNVLPLGGVVFHESRCGSTLVANLLQWHSPTENIVYSESGPLLAALKLMGSGNHPEQEADDDVSASNEETKGDDDDDDDDDDSDDEEKEKSQPKSRQLNPNRPDSEQHNHHNHHHHHNHHQYSALSKQVIQDVVFIMSRTSNPHKRRVFFKVQSIGTLQLALFRAAFPHTPWMFVYRDPVEVLMSHLDQGGGRNANCVRSQRSGTIPSAITRIVQQLGEDPEHLSPRQLSIPEYCAAHLATLTEAAVQELEDSMQSSSSSLSLLGLPVNYKDLPDWVLNDVWPTVWQLEIHGEAQRRMQQGSHSYSKSGGERDAEQFQGDSQAKQERASRAVNAAAQTFLHPSYQRLEQLARQAKQQLASAKAAKAAQ